MTKLWTEIQSWDDGFEFEEVVSHSGDWSLAVSGNVKLKLREVF